MKKIRLGVNIDHVATLRNARNEGFPNLLDVTSNLKKLDVQHNRLITIPSAYAQLRSLNICGNPIATLPTKLNHLTIDTSQWKALKKLLATNVSVRTLDVSHIQFDNYSELSPCLPNIKKLIVSPEQLPHLPYASFSISCSYKCM